MKVCILDSFEKSSTISECVYNEIKKEFVGESPDIAHITLNTMEVQLCKGCLGCWWVSPGKCVISDSFQQIAREYINSDVAVILTRVTFGGYDGQMKRVVDRFACLLSALFKDINGECHHRKRYAKYPNIICIGVMEEKNDEEAGIFNQLIERNAMNLHSNLWYSDIIEAAECDSPEAICGVVKKAVMKVRN